MHDHLSRTFISQFLEDWLDNIVHFPCEDGKSPLIVPNTFLMAPNNTPTPKRRRKEASLDISSPSALIDLDITPRAAAPPSEPSISSDTSASAADVTSQALSQSRRSGASSPRKREITLRQARDHPVHRVDIFASAKDLPREVLELARCLTELGNGERPAIPSLFEVPISSPLRYTRYVCC